MLGPGLQPESNLVFNAQSTITVISGRGLRQESNLVFKAQSTITVISGRGFRQKYLGVKRPANHYGYISVRAMARYVTWCLMPSPTRTLECYNTKGNSCGISLEQQLIRSDLTREGTAVKWT